MSHMNSEENHLLERYKEPRKNRTNTLAHWPSCFVKPENLKPKFVTMDTTTGNPFAELERLEGLEPFATHQEILTQLRAGGEKESDDGQKAAPQLPRTKLPRFSEAEVHAFRNEGWTLVAPRARTRPSEAPSCQSVEAVAPRALLTGVPPQRSTLAAPPTEKKFWRYLRWGALGALGAIVLSKLASRR